ncbi:MAG: YcaO-like family protein [Candidatus Aminicenantes bacterium]|nr:YcaO-like family protein [Candidatus Aminicenantes bacterium]
MKPRRQCGRFGGGALPRTSVLWNLSPSPFKARRCLKGFEGFKVCSPDITVSRIGEAFSRLNLVVSIEFASSGLARGIGSYYWCVARLRPSKDMDVCLLTTYGKGMTPALCAASGAAEMVERFSAVMNLKSRKKILRASKSEGRPCRGHGNPPELFREATRMYTRSGIDSLPVFRSCTSLGTGKAAVYPESFYRRWQTSQGLAAGNSLEEAAVQGICEVVERNTLRAVLGKGFARPRVDPASFETPLLRHLHDAVSETGVRITYLDWSLWGVPVVGALFENSRPGSSQETSRFVVGVATSPAGAALRCLTEYLQQGNPSVAGPDTADELMDRLRAKITKIDVPGIRQFSEALGFNKALPSIYDKKTSGPPLPVKPLSDLPDVSHQDLAVEIRRMARRLQGHGIDLFIDDLTLPVLNFPVVRVIPVVANPSLESVLNPVLLHNNPSDSGPVTVQIRRVAKWHKAMDRLWEELSKAGWPSHRSVRARRKLIRLLESHIRSGYNIRYFGLLGTEISVFELLARLSIAVHDLDRAERYNEACMLTQKTNPDIIMDRIWIARERKDSRTVDDFAWLVGQMEPDVDIEEALRRRQAKVLDPNPFSQCEADCESMVGNPICRECGLNYVSEDIWWA